MIDILSLTIEELEEILKEQNQPKFRAGQLFYDLHNGKHINDITTIPQTVKQFFNDNYITALVEIIKVQESKDGTKKFLFKLHDNNLVEGVLMTYKFGYTLCVSSQVGCNMRCKFCASGLDGLVRNLSAGEILGQILTVNTYLGGTAKERKVTNIVLMGSGEPLDNYDNVAKFMRILMCDKGINFGERNISLSTCGVAKNIIKLADDGFKVNICLSLHASNEETRKELMPISKAYNINEVMDAFRYYYSKTKRRLLVEYILIDGVNCSRENALELVKILKGMDCILNLIMLNEVKETGLRRCSEETRDNFAKVLLENKIDVTTRRSLGNDIDGACGQLRRRYLKNDNEKK